MEVTQGPNTSLQNCSVNPHSVFLGVIVSTCRALLAASHLMYRPFSQVTSSRLILLQVFAPSRTSPPAFTRTPWAHAQGLHGLASWAGTRAGDRRWSSGHSCHHGAQMPWKAVQAQPSVIIKVLVFYKVTMRNWYGRQQAM